MFIYLGLCITNTDIDTDATIYMGHGLNDKDKPQKSMTWTNYDAYITRMLMSVHNFLIDN